MQGVEERKRKKIIRMILYPLYFDNQVSLKGGRRVSLDHAVKDPNINMLKKVLSSLSFEFDIESNKRHPKSTASTLGRVNIHTKEKKSKVIQIIANALLKSFPERENNKTDNS